MLPSMAELYFVVIMMVVCCEWREDGITWNGTEQDGTRRNRTGVGWPGVMGKLVGQDGW